MQKKIHPEYHNDTEVTCACGNKFTTGSVLKTIRVEKFQERADKKTKASATRKGKKVKKAVVAAKKTAKKAAAKKSDK